MTLCVGAARHASEHPLGWGGARPHGAPPQCAMVYTREARPRRPRCRRAADAARPQARAQALRGAGRRCRKPAGRRSRTEHYSISPRPSPLLAAYLV